MHNTENIELLVKLLKKHNIHHFVISPGGTNISLVKALQNDPFFKCYSVVDERSAAYFAIGLFLQTGCIIALSCTSAQATRNYVPGLTEAFYKRVPLLAITMSKHPRFIYQGYMQGPNQTSLPEDSVSKSFSLPFIQSTSDFLHSSRLINEAIIELKQVCRPIQINIPWQDFEIAEIDYVNVKSITRYSTSKGINKDVSGKKILVVAGEHRPYSNKEVDAINNFCSQCDAAIYVNWLSNIHTSYNIEGNLFLSTIQVESELKDIFPDIIITIGGQTGDYPLYRALSKTNYNAEHWSVNEMGNIEDTYDKLTRVYAMPVLDFFENAVENDLATSHSYLDKWKKIEAKYNRDIDLPLSNTYMAQQLSKSIPENSILNLAILNSIRNWNLFAISPSITSYANVAAFGIDGCVSMFIGESVATDQLCFLVIGDLAFFYDLNAIGIREIKNNVRILIINNNGGVEFKLSSGNHKETDKYIAAAGHFKNAKGWAETCGFLYLSSNSREGAMANIPIFTSKNERPIIFEVFVTDEMEYQAYNNIIQTNKNHSTSILISKGINKIKRII